MPVAETWWVRRLQTDYLRYLLDIAELGSISAAAKRSFITPQGIRRAIGVLESEVGFPLLVREGRSTQLTEYGKAILKDARAMLDAQDRMQRIIAEVGIDHQSEQYFAIHAFFHLAVFDTKFFTPLTGPDQDILRLVRMSSCSNDEVVKQLTDAPDEQNDVARIGMIALFSPRAEENAELISTLAKRGFMVYPYITYHDEILISTKSRFANRSSITCEEARTLPFIVVNEDLRKIVGEVIKPGYCTLAPDTSFRDRLVANNEMVSVVPSINRLAPQKPSTIQIPLSDGWDVTLAFVGRTNILSDKIVKRMISILNDWYIRPDGSMDDYYTIHFAN